MNSARSGHYSAPALALAAVSTPIEGDTMPDCVTVPAVGSALWLARADAQPLPGPGDHIVGGLLARMVGCQVFEAGRPYPMLAVKLPRQLQPTLAAFPPLGVEGVASIGQDKRRD